MSSATPAHSFRYEACDIPPGVRIDDWKRPRAAVATIPTRRWPRLRFLLRRF
jgi:hypothetical protein